MLPRKIHEVFHRIRLLCFDPWPRRFFLPTKTYFAKHFISWLAAPGKGLCVDPFGGRLTTAKACEELGIEYLVSELHYEYIKPALTQFIHHKGFLFNPAFNAFK